MRLATATILASCIPAHADVFDAIHRMSQMGPQGPCFEVIQIENRAGIYNGIERFETIHGEIALQYTTNGGHNTEDDDRVVVVEMPAGVMADPMDQGIPDLEGGENGIRTVCFFIGVS